MSGEGSSNQPAGWFRMWNNAVARIGEVGLTAFVVYAVLLRHADAEGRCFPSVDRIASIVVSHKNTVLRAIAKLESAGWIVVERKPGAYVERKPGAYNVYHLPPMVTGTTGETGGETPVPLVRPTGTTGETPTGTTGGTLRATNIKGDLSKGDKGAFVLENDRPKKETDSRPQAFEALRLQWNSLPDVPRCLKATPPRLAAFRARCRDPDWLKQVPAAFAKVAASKFCRGKNDRGWRMDMDFLLKPDTLTKILEGKYDGRKNGSVGKPVRQARSVARVSSRYGPK